MVRWTLLYKMCYIPFKMGFTARFVFSFSSCLPYNLAAQTCVRWISLKLWISNTYMHGWKFPSWLDRRTDENAWQTSWSRVGTADTQPSLGSAGLLSDTHETLQSGRRDLINAPSIRYSWGVQHMRVQATWVNKNTALSAIIHIIMAGV